MTSATLCFSGFSRDEAAQVQQIFEQAAASRHWLLVPEPDARVLVIDMDSMYGHMTWLKAHNGGKLTVGLTAGERSETDFLLRRPLSAETLSALLVEVAGQLDQPRPAAPVEAPERTDSPAPADVPSEADITPEAAAVVEPMVVTAAAPDEQTQATEADSPVGTAGQSAAMPADSFARAPLVSDLLMPGALPGPAKLQLPGAPLLVLDPVTRTYAGCATLKPLAVYATSAVDVSAAQPIDNTELEAIQARSGGAQPYLRLLWLCGLSVGRGELLPGFHTPQKFQLTKWPQIEREFPKHFRVATVMMKGPATVASIAELSGVDLADVTDFVNAGLLTGAVIVEGSAGTGGDIAKACAILARPRLA